MKARNKKSFKSEEKFKNNAKRSISVNFDNRNTRYLISKKDKY